MPSSSAVTGPIEALPPGLSGRTSASWIPVDVAARRARRAAMQRKTGGVRLPRRRWMYLSAGISLAALGGVAALLLVEPRAEIQLPPSDSEVPIVAPAGTDTTSVAPTEPTPEPAINPEPQLSLELRIAPRNARVRIDGEIVASRDGRVVYPVSAGSHEVLVEAAGRAPFRHTYEVANTSVRDEISLAPVRSTGSRRDRDRDRGERRPPQPTVSPDGTIDPFQ